MSVESKCHFNIEPLLDPSYKEVLIIETDNWASCEIVNKKHLL